MDQGELWNNYNKRYHDLIISIRQSDVVASVSRVLLRDYPRNLPADYRKQLADGMKLTAEALVNAVSYWGFANSRLTQ